MAAKKKSAAKKVAKKVAKKTAPAPQPAREQQPVPDVQAPAQSDQQQPQEHGSAIERPGLTPG